MDVGFNTGFTPLINNLNNSVGLGAKFGFPISVDPVLPDHAVEEYALAQALGGGVLDPKTLEVIPKSPTLVEKVFTCVRKVFNKSLRGNHA